MAPIWRFRTTWGVDPGQDFENWAAWFPSLKAQGYAGVEVDIAGVKGDLSTLRRLCDEQRLEISVLIHSEWPMYLGPRPTGLNVDRHIKHYREQLIVAKTLRPHKINSHSGSDHWSVEESIDFFQQTLKVNAELGLSGKVCHETHRLRSFFNPYNTVQILEKVPGLLITADISHHVVVCERLLDSGEEDKQLLSKIIPHVNHIHARMGTTQSSQCPDPTNPVFAAEREFFEDFWKKCVKAIVASQGPDKPVTFVPEYGPFPYHPFGSSRSFSEVADAEGTRLQDLFEEIA